MTKDPVCGREVEPKTARAKTNHQGRDYVFCSDSCKMQFDQHPERYAQQKAQAPQQQQQRGGAA
jgi:YHS domain-containing protein